MYALVNVFPGGSEPSLGSKPSYAFVNMTYRALKHVEQSFPWKRWVVDVYVAYNGPEYVGHGTIHPDFEFGLEMAENGGQDGQTVVSAQERISDASHYHL